MDLIAQLSRWWRDLIMHSDGGLKSYVVRVGATLSFLLILACAFHLGPASADRRTLLRQITAAIAGVFFVLFLPLGWLSAAPEAVQVVLVTVSLCAAVVLPPFVSASLIRTYGRQRLARRVLYGVILGLFLLQIIVSWGGE